MNEHTIESEPNPDRHAVRELTDAEHVPMHNTLGETRTAIDELDDYFYPILADYLDRRTALTDDAVRFKESPDQVAALNRQMEVLMSKQDRAEREGRRSTGIIVDVFDTIITGSVERQQELFSKTRPIDPEES